MAAINSSGGIFLSSNTTAAAINGGIFKGGGTAISVVEIAGVGFLGVCIDAALHGEGAIVVNGTISVCSGGSHIYRAVSLDGQIAIVGEQSGGEIRANGNGVALHIQGKGLTLVNGDGIRYLSILQQCHGTGFVGRRYCRFHSCCQGIVQIAVHLGCRGPYCAFASRTAAVIEQSSGAGVQIALPIFCTSFFVIGVRAAGLLHHTNCIILQFNTIDVYLFHFTIAGNGSNHKVSRKAAVGDGTLLHSQCGVTHQVAHESRGLLHGQNIGIVHRYVRQSQRTAALSANDHCKHAGTIGVDDLIERFANGNAGTVKSQIFNGNIATAVPNKGSVIIAVLTIAGLTVLIGAAHTRLCGKTGNFVAVAVDRGPFQSFIIRNGEFSIITITDCTRADRRPIVSRQIQISRDIHSIARKGCASIYLLGPPNKGLCTADGDSLSGNIHQIVFWRLSYLVIPVRLPSVKGFGSIGIPSLRILNPLYSST